MLVFRHPKYYEEMRRRAKKFQKEQADKQASERASRGAGGPTSNEPGSELYESTLAEYRGVGEELELEGTPVFVTARD